MKNDYISVTEIAGDDVTQGQIDRMCNRYYWAKPYCTDKVVLEVACGTGPGLGYLSEVAHLLQAGDYSNTIISIAHQHYGDRVPLVQFDAQEMPFKDSSKDIIILFEAIYYLPNVEKFIRECVRVLRPGGKVLIATSNKDLYDFNPSPYSYKYYGVVALNELLKKFGFAIEFYGDSPVNQVAFHEKVLRPIKKLAVLLNLIPKTMSGKKFLKKIVFGKLLKMPTELTVDTGCYIAPNKIPPSEPDFIHKIIFCVAALD